MNYRILLATAVFLLAPSLALAFGCPQKLNESASLTCAAGLSFDPNSGKCVENPTS